MMISSEFMTESTPFYEEKKKYQSLIAKLQLRLELLKAYAKVNRIPKKVPIPAFLPIRLTKESIQSKEVRDYLVRRYIDWTYETLGRMGTMEKEYKVPPGLLGHYFRPRVTRQTKLLTQFLTLLNSFS